MQLYKGQIWKSIEGPCKGEQFKILKIDEQFVTYCKCGGNTIYTAPRKHMEKMLERVNAFWKERNIQYKKGKQNAKFNN